MLYVHEMHADITDLYIYQEKATSDIYAYMTSTLIETLC